MSHFCLDNSWRKHTDNIIGWKVDTGNMMIYWLWHLIISFVCLVTDIQIHKGSPFILVSLNFICVIIAGI